MALINIHDKIRHMNSKKSLHEALKKYQAILNEIDDGVGETDLKGHLTYINDAGCRIWGYRRKELIGSSYRTYVDEKEAELLRREYSKVYRSGTPTRFVHEVIRKDGQRILVEDSVSPIRAEDGTITGFRSVQRDVTAQEKAQREINEHRARLEAIFEGVQDAIILVDPARRAIEANPSMESICGIGIREIRGMILSEAPGPCNKGCREILKQSIDMKKNILGHRIECGHHQRDHQIVSVNSSLILGDQGHTAGAVLVIRDITMLNDLQRELRERNQFQNLIGRSKRMQQIYTLLEDLTNLETTVLVTGESGTGKELVARALHYCGQRAFKPFVTVNCTALAENLLESELFGHVRGAFTGAIKDKQGRFEAADGGTILLDEIGDISPLIQLKLLRVLQEKILERVGESTPRKVDVRVIACTNKDLKEKVRVGEFREDLYYRLMVVEVALPPLRERLEDIPLLVDHFLGDFNHRFKKVVEGISQEVLTQLMLYPWPGNVRELEHAIEHAFILCRGHLITLAHLPAAIRDYNSKKTGNSPPPLRPRDP